MSGILTIQLVVLVAVNLAGILAAALLGRTVYLMPGVVLAAGLLPFLAGGFAAWRRRRMGREDAGVGPGTLAYNSVLLALLALWGMTAALSGGEWRPIWVSLTGGLAVLAGLFGFMEYVVFRVISLFRLGALVRVTYYEALLQPFTQIVLGVSLVTIVVFTMVPFYTLAEDFKMYRDVASMAVLMAALIVMTFASSKVIDEEIDNRTMLTLMSKPIARWQVVVGKYLGIVALVFVVIAVLGLATAVGSYLRYYDDMRMDIGMAQGGAKWNEVDALLWGNMKGVLALIPLFTLQFLQVATLAAVAVAVSTRYPLALNVVIIATLYVGANMMRYLEQTNLGQPWRALAGTVNTVLPSLSVFDISQRLIYGTYTVGAKDFLEYAGKGMPITYGQIWGYVGMASVYALLFIVAALSVGTALFRNRELT